MSFNYGREEKKWRLWKEAEEKELRGLGVDEDTIEKLHTYDWAVFNSDRRYYRRLKEAGTYLEEFAVMKMQGYSTHEIAVQFTITEKAIYRRMDRLKEKLKNFFE